MPTTTIARVDRITRHPLTFTAGLATIAVGLALQLVDLWNARHNGFRLANMGLEPHMITGMILTTAGVGAAALHLLRPPPAGTDEPARRTATNTAYPGTARLRRPHVVLLGVLSIALVIDTLKPATLGFVLPGTRAEYGLTKAQVTLLPLITLVGAAAGSLLWGILADRIGRRRPIMLATLIFAATSVCATMPSYEWNIAMCFLMGLSAGGMLPAVITLLAECLPTGMRGPAVVIVTAAGSAGGYLIASGLAAWLLPIGSWRLLWAMGLPTAIILALVSRCIPESPRFLLRHGRTAEAQAIAARYGCAIAQDNTRQATHHTPRRSIRLPAALSLLGIGIGMANWGLVTFLPLLLQTRISPQVVANVLLSSALISLPVAIAGAWAYARISSKWSVVTCGVCVVAALIVLALAGNTLVGADHRGLIAVLGVLLATVAALAAMFNTYAAETSRTVSRGFGAGLAAGSFKLGGLAGPALFATGVTGLAAASAAIAVPLAAGAVLVGAFGRETRGRELEAITEQPNPSSDTSNLREIHAVA